MESACDICGCTQTNLVDGYYYCTECGTQDTNVRETLVEIVSLGEGIIAHGARRRIARIPQAPQEQMTDEWYKWHSLNFLLQGLASELVELGVAPTFKTKLLWVWTRYMKKYQNKADFGLPQNEEDETADDIEEEDDDIDAENVPMNEDYFMEDEEDVLGIPIKAKKEVKLKVETINMALVITLLYVALNLDKSHIQLTHLMRFILEGRLSVQNWRKFVPKELYPKKLRCCLLFNRQWFLYSYPIILRLGLKLFNELDLGNPIVPDLRLLVDNYMKELCLPNDMKPLVLSLMHYRSYDYLDMNAKLYKIGKIPSYELYVMAHILCAMKICFGIDDNYENELSDAVDKINDSENYPKSYSKPTERLFSFREWLNHIQFRKCMLWSHSLYLGAPNYMDMDDYVAFEHLSEKPDYKKTFKDEITRDVLNKLPDVEVNVIPKSEFSVTTTPHATYTRVIADHQQDPIIKQSLREDFTQYSLKYITEDMLLVDPDSTHPKNIITGVKSQHVKDHHKKFTEFVNFTPTKYSTNMVYVRDCDNHNWLLTQRPKLEHVVQDRKNINGKMIENESDTLSETEFGPEENSVITDTEKVLNDQSIITDINSDDKNILYESDSKETSVITEDSKVLSDLNSIIETEICKEKLIGEDLKISEEVENENIFDDKFENLDVKKEEDKDLESYDNDDEPMADTQADETFPIPDIFRDRVDRVIQEYRTGRDSDESSEDSVRINPESLDRNKAIKELVIHACNKYKVSLPGKYICRPKKKTVVKRKSINPERAKVLGLVKQKIIGLIADYHRQIQEDIFIQMSTMVQSAIADFNESKEKESPADIEPMEVEDIDNQNENEPNDIETLNETTEDLVLDETTDNDKYMLFDEDSDGETHAEDLLPKKNPMFDETTHDISQLYIKPTEDGTAAELKLNPNLYKIIDSQIEKGAGDKPSSSEAEESDSEEEMSLTMIQELKLLREQLTKQVQQTKEKQLQPLIKSPVPSYKYWVKHYMSSGLLAINRRLAVEIDVAFPSTFKIVLGECADVVGYSAFYLYRSLQRVETCIKDKYVLKKNIGPRYFKTQTKEFRDDTDML